MAVRFFVTITTHRAGFRTLTFNTGIARGAVVVGIACVGAIPVTTAKTITIAVIRTGLVFGACATVTSALTLCIGGARKRSGVFAADATHAGSHTVGIVVTHAASHGEATATGSTVEGRLPG